MKIKFLQQSTDQRRDMILNGGIVKTILMLSVPTLMMGVVQSLMPLSDGLFINNISGTLVASAVTYSTPIINMMIALAQGLSVAAMAMLGQINGRGDYARVKHISTQIMVTAFLMGVVMAPVLALIAIPIAGHVHPDISHNVFVYIALNGLVLPFSFLESIYNAIKNASGKPEATFIRMVLMLVLKIIFNILFIAVLRLDIVGCALSSLCANASVGVWMYFELFVKKGEDKLTLLGFRFDLATLKDLFRLGIPSMLTSVMLNFGFFLINNETQKYGPVVLNGQGIASNITTVCFNLPSAFGSAVTTMVSMNVGAGQGIKARKSCLVGCVMSMITAVCIIAVIVPLSAHLTTLFTHDADVLAVANNSLHIYTYSVVGFGVCMVVQGAFIGLGRTKVPLVIGFLRIWLLRYIFILATERWLSFYAVFWGNLFSNYVAALIIVILILRTRWVSVIDL